MPRDDPPAIEVFQDLDLICPDGERLREALCASARLPWRHSTAAEKVMARNAWDDVEIIVFERTEGNGVAASRLVLWPEPDRYRVANIVPLECRELGERGYNDVLNDFVDQVARPASEREGFAFRQTDRMQSITDWTSREAADATASVLGRGEQVDGVRAPLGCAALASFPDGRPLGEGFP